MSKARRSASVFQDYDICCTAYQLSPVIFADMRDCLHRVMVAQWLNALLAHSPATITTAISEYPAMVSLYILRRHSKLITSGGGFACCGDPQVDKSANQIRFADPLVERQFSQYVIRRGRQQHTALYKLVVFS